LRASDPAGCRTIAKLIADLNSPILSQPRTESGVCDVAVEQWGLAGNVYVNLVIRNKVMLRESGTAERDLGRQAVTGPLTKDLISVSLALHCGILPALLQPETLNQLGSGISFIKQSVGNLLLLENPILYLFPNDWRWAKGTIRCRLSSEKSVSEK
jgi:hypothetical protein